MRSPMAHALAARVLSNAAAAFLLAVLCLGPARGAEFTDRAALFVSGLCAQAIGPGAGADTPTRRLSALLEKFDFAGFGQLTLGPYWTGASPAQRSEFASLLTVRFARS